MFSNVNLWFAKDINNNIITIDEVDVNSDNTNKNKNYCPLCGSEVIPKATKSKLITAHFAHIDASKCSSESYLHFWFKHKFLESGEKFIITSDKEREYVCKEVLVEQSYTVGDRIYRPDVTIKTECGNVIYFEMKFSNEKKLKDYIDIWLELKNIVVEVDIKSLLNKDKLPVFKALFYDGKCFNVRKRSDDGKYHDIIGKYKENILSKADKNDNKLKERLQKLDWFWDDVFRYKKGEVDIEYMTELIDSIDERDDKDIINAILRKPKCIDLYKNYLYFKTENIKKEIINYFQSNDELYRISISEVKKSLYNNYLTSEIEIHNINDNCYSSYDIFRYSLEEIKSKINECINRIKIRQQIKIDLEFAKNNIYIKNAIQNIDSKYKLIDENYYFYNRFGYEQNVNFCYNLESKIDFRLPQEIIYSNIEKDIEYFMENKIKEYMCTVESFFNHDIIINLLNKLNQKYINVYIKRRNKKERKIGRNKYVDIFVTNVYNYKIKFKIIAEDCIRINVCEIENDRFDKTIGTDIYLYKNKLYRSRKTWDCFNDKYELEIFKNNSDFNKLNLFLTKEINKIISNNSSHICLDCNTKFTLEIGEFNFFINKGIQFPRRCKQCRDKRKELNSKKEELILE